MATTTKTWFIKDDRTLVTWSAAVTNGVANYRIRRATQTTQTANNVSVTGELVTYVWANTGDTVSAGKVAAAQAASTTDPLPVVVDQTPTPTTNGSNSGTAGTVTVRSTTTSTPGGNASVVNAGTPTAAVLDFTIPRGIAGTNGVNGTNGQDGAVGLTGATGPGYTSARINAGRLILTTSLGADVDLGNIQGADGATSTTPGPTGPGYTAANITNGRLILTRTDNSTVDLGSVAGPPGTNGSAGANGINGTNGSNGSNGADGQAATIAVGTVTTGSAGTSASVTNTGTSSAANLNFTIPRGNTGTAGTAGTITVGTVTTGAAGSSATVTNTGTSTAATFNFSIPQGVQGVAGTNGTNGAAGTNGTNGATGPAAWTTPTSWNNTTTYTPGPPASTVTYQGQTFVALTSNTNSTPVDGATWALVAAKGSNGTAGTNGTNGTNGVDAQPGVTIRYLQTTAQTLTSGSYTIMAFDTADPNAAYVTKGTQGAGSQFTVTKAGTYAITASGGYTTGSAGEFETAILIGGSFMTGMETPLSSTVKTTHNVAYTTRLAVNDVVTIRVYQSSGSNNTTNTGSGARCNVTFTWLTA